MKHLPKEQCLNGWQISLKKKKTVQNSTNDRKLFASWLICFSDKSKTMVYLTQNSKYFENNIMALAQ